MEDAARRAPSHLGVLGVVVVLSLVGQALQRAKERPQRAAPPATESAARSAPAARPPQPYALGQPVPTSLPTCATCAGQGQAYSYTETDEWGSPHRVTCPDCGGSGRSANGSTNLAYGTERFVVPSGGGLGPGYYNSQAQRSRDNLDRMNQEQYRKVYPSLEGHEVPHARREILEKGLW